MNTQVSNKKKLTGLKMAEVELKYKALKSSVKQPRISTPEMAASYLRGIWDPGSMELFEDFVVLILNASKRCLGWSRISRGGKTAAIVDPAHVFRVALLGNAHSIICAHCHPSGNLTFSRADIALTKRLVEAGRMLDIQVEDHILITAHGYKSYREEGLL